MIYPKVLVFVLFLQYRAAGYHLKFASPHQQDQVIVLVCPIASEVVNVFFGQLHAH